MTAYMPVKENAKRYTHIKTKVVYDLGGYDHWNGSTKERGYYLIVEPVEKGEFSEISCAFVGYKALVKSVTRKSKKAESEAEQIAKERYVKGMVDRICMEEGLELVS